MPFWGDELIERRLDDLVVAGNRASIKQGAYELTMGDEVFITSESVKRQLQRGEQFFIPPGQMALLLADEFIMVPRDVFALISMKTTYKFRGLLNVSGFHVDPGFRGKLVFSVYNASSRSVQITRGSPVFLIWYADITDAGRSQYSGSHQGQLTISDAMVREIQGEILSPASLHAEIGELRALFEQTRWHAGFIGLFLGATFSGVLLPLAIWTYHSAANGNVRPASFSIGVIATVIFGSLLMLVRRGRKKP